MKLTLLIFLLVQPFFICVFPGGAQCRARSFLSLCVLVYIRLE